MLAVLAGAALVLVLNEVQKEREQKRQDEKKKEIQRMRKEWDQEQKQKEMERRVIEQPRPSPVRIPKSLFYIKLNGSYYTRSDNWSLKKENAVSFSSREDAAKAISVRHLRSVGATIGTW